MIKNLLFLSIFTFVVVLSWISFSVYHTYTTSQISPDAAIRITPIPDKFDQDMINVLKSKKRVDADLTQDKYNSNGEVKETPDSQAVTLPQSSQSAQPIQLQQSEPPQPIQSQPQITPVVTGVGL